MSDTASEFRPKSRTEQLIEARYSRPAETVIRELYEGEGLTQAQIASNLDISREWVVGFMRDRGIPTRDRRAVKTAA